MDNFATNAISFSQDYFKLLSVRKLIQVEMLYPGSVVPLAMFTFVITAYILKDLAKDKRKKLMYRWHKNWEISFVL